VLSSVCLGHRYVLSSVCLGHRYMLSLFLENTLIMVVEATETFR